MSASPLYKRACWRADVRTVLQNTATEADEATFLATHLEIPLTWRYGSGDDRPGGTDEESFLAAFLSEPNYCYALVEGANGTGKSHLVRWMHTRILDDSARRVVFVPRADSNLKSVIQRILDSVADDTELDELRQRLQQTLAASEIGSPKENMLNALAVAVGPSAIGTGVLEGIADEDERELYENLTRQLPPLLQSHTFSERLLAPGALVDRMVNHVLGRSSAEGDDREMVITFEDLRPALDSVDLNLLDDRAKKAFRELTTNFKYQRRTVDWLQRNLRRTLNHFLKFSAEDLNDLLLKVRRRLKTRGMELVLLVEDFAKTVGFDHALFDAVVVKRDQLEPDLCDIRSVFALTPGFLEHHVANPASIRQRVTLHATLDVKDRRESHMAVRMGARYLNALRLADDQLQDWGRERLRGQAPPRPAPNACDDCPFDARSFCHAEFGEVNGVGLYPFNENALETMYECAKRLDNSTSRVEAFVPRKLLTSVLPKVLTDLSDVLLEGEFPPASLARDLKAQDFTAESRGALDRAFPGRSDFRDRAQSLVQFWGNPKTLAEPSDAVYRTFGIPPVRLSGGRTPTSPSPSPTPRTPVTPPISTSLPPESPVHEPEVEDPDLAAIEAWMNGAKRLPRGLGEQLQSALLGLVKETIPWDDLRLLPNWFVKTAPTILSEKSFHFEYSQEGESTATPIYVTIGDNPNILSQTAMALQGLLQSKRTGGWKFAHAAEDRRALASLVDDIVAELISQLKNAGSREQSFDPIETLTNLAAVSARLRGHAVADSVDPLFRTDSVGLAHRVRAWSDLTGLLAPNEIVDSLKAFVGCRKNASAGVQIVDATSMLPVLETLRANPIPALRKPKFAAHRWLQAERYTRDVRPTLEAAINAEHLDWLKAYDRLRGAFVCDGPLTEEATSRPYSICLAEGCRQLIACAQTSQAAGLSFLLADLQGIVRSVQAITKAQIEVALSLENPCRAAKTTAEKFAVVERGDACETLKILAGFAKKWMDAIHEAIDKAELQEEHFESVRQGTRRQTESLKSDIAGLIAITGEFMGGE